MRILIICTGNSCRSQMAHAFLQSFDSELEVFSAGTEPTEQVNPKAVQTMQEVGIDISSHKPTNINAYVNQRWDYVITVCDDADKRCPFFSGEVEKRIHIGFDDPSRAEGSAEFIDAEFRCVRDEIKVRFKQFYEEEIKQKVKK